MSGALGYSFAVAAFLSQPVQRGAHAIPVFGADGFPPSGSLDIDIGLATHERVSFVSVTRTSFQLASPLQHDHELHCAVQLADGPGEGWGDSEAEP